MLGSRELNATFPLTLLLAAPLQLGDVGDDFSFLLKPGRLVFFRPNVPVVGLKPGF